MTFYPQHAPIPSELRTDEFIVRPLLARDNGLDYEAVMSSKEMLRVWEQSDWPADDFALADNLEDLERHEREHLERIAFTFTVMNPIETECLGCVYIVPLDVALSHFSSGRADLSVVNDYEACASFWVRLSRLADRLDQRLMQALVVWLAEEWAFARVYYNTSSEDKRQVDLFTRAGLQELYSFDIQGRPARYLVFG